MPANNNGQPLFNLEAPMTPVGSTDNIKTNYEEMNVQLLEANNQTWYQ